MAGQEPIHIKESREGTFRAAAKRHSESMGALASAVEANPGNYSEALRKKAQFYTNIVKH